MPQERIKVVIAVKLKKKQKKKRGEGNNMETGLKTKSIYVNIRYQVYSMLNSLYL